MEKGKLAKCYYFIFTTPTYDRSNYTLICYFSSNLVSWKQYKIEISLAFHLIIGKSGINDTSPGVTPYYRKKTQNGRRH